MIAKKPYKLVQESKGNKDFALPEEPSTWDAEANVAKLSDEIAENEKNVEETSKYVKQDTELRQRTEKTAIIKDSQDFGKAVNDAISDPTASYWESGMVAK